MAALIQSLAPRQANSVNPMGWDDWAGLWGLSGLEQFLTTTMPKEQETPAHNYLSLIESAYMRNSVVFTCLAIRARLFSEARFQFQQMRNGRPGRLFGTPALNVLERPETGKTTRDLLQIICLDADLGGTGFMLRRPTAIRRLRPDWMVIGYGSSKSDSELGSWDPDAEIIGFGYYPGGMASGAKPIFFLPEEVATFSPTKDPRAKNRGMSLLTAGVREIAADNGAVTSKLAFYNNAATPNLALKFPPTMPREKADEWIELFEQEHKGAANAFRTLFLGGGMDATAIGLSFEQQDFAAVQGKAETRIAGLTGVHPVVAALSEGLAGSSLNAGNFQSAMRLVADATMRPLWGDIASSFESIVPPLPGTRLWYDDRDIPFMRQDVKDQAEITNKNAATITALVNGGFDPDSAIDAVLADDMSRLVHTGKVSVQLQEPGAPSSAPANGNAPAATVRARTTFYASDTPFDKYGQIEEGALLDGSHPLVHAYPALFEPEDSNLTTLVKRLRQQGLSVPAIAHRVDRSDRQVRRLLAA